MNGKASIGGCLAFLGAALLLGAGPRSARADGISTPFIEMRAAAEALAQVSPEPGARPGVPSTPLSVAKQPARNIRLTQAAMRAAVRLEVEREMGANGNKASAPLASPSGKARLKGQNYKENGRDDAAQARASAVQAQQARQSRSVSEQRASRETPKASAAAANR